MDDSDNDGDRRVQCGELMRRSMTKEYSAAERRAKRHLLGGSAAPFAARTALSLSDHCQYYNTIVVLYGISIMLAWQIGYVYTCFLY